MWLILIAILSAALVVAVIIMVMTPSTDSVTPAPTGSTEPSPAPLAQPSQGPAGFISPAQGPSGFTTPGPAPLSPTSSGSKSPSPSPGPSSGSKSPSPSPGPSSGSKSPSPSPDLPDELIIPGTFRMSTYIYGNSMYRISSYPSTRIDSYMCNGCRIDNLNDFERTFPYRFIRAATADFDIKLKIENTGTNYFYGSTVDPNDAANVIDNELLYYQNNDVDPLPSGSYFTFSQIKFVSR